jgi:hypothetical protein
MGQVVQTLCKESGEGNEEVTEKCGAGQALCAYNGAKNGKVWLLCDYLEEALVALCLLSLITPQIYPRFQV